jgi:energy-coupling factor transport system permease protein
MVSFTYRDKGTLIHRLNPYYKLAWFVGIVVLALLFDHPVHLLLLFISTMCLIMAARVGREWASLLPLMLPLFLTLVFINAIAANEGDHVIWYSGIRVPTMGIMTITLEGVVYASIMSLRLLVIFSAFAIVTYAVHPDDLMLVLLKFRLPYKSVLVSSVATRFIPTFLRDATTISDVQRCRGLELDRGNLIRRVRHYVAIIVPLLSNSLDRTVQVAEAMEARAFGSGSKRTFYKQIGLSRVDILTLAVAVVSIGLGIVMRFLGQGTYNPYDALDGLGLAGLEWGLLFALGLLLLTILPLSRVKARIDLD